MLDFANPPLLQQIRVRFLSRKPKAHFLHISKTGGTALSYCIRQSPITERYRIFVHPHEVALSAIPRGEKVFFFLRDPVARFVSAFYSRQRQGRPRYYTPWSEAERTAFETFTTADQLAVALSAGGLAQEKAEVAMRGIRLLRDSYWQWLTDERTLISRWADVLFVGFQENMAEDFARLREFLGLPANITLPEDDFHAHRNPPSVDRRLSPIGRENLQRRYAADYECLALVRDLIRSKLA